MTTFESNVKQLAYPQQTVYDTLSDLTHLQGLKDRMEASKGQLTDEQRNAFMADVARTTRAMQKIFNPDKINYGAYSDTLSHLHFHLIPKYKGGPDFGGVFQMNPKQVYLTDAEYQEMAEKLKAELA